MKKLTTLAMGILCCIVANGEELVLQSDPAIAIKVPTTAGKNYQLESTGDLGNPIWIPDGLPFLGDGTFKTHLRQPFGGTQFYRVSEYDLTSGLVAYYPLDGNVADGSSNANHGTTSGAIPTEDRFGNSSGAFSFNGVNQSITIPSSPATNPGSGEMSLSIWAKFGSVNQTSHLLGKSDGISFANKWIVQYINPSSRFTYHINSTSGSANSQNATAPWSFTSNVWVHLVFTKSGSTYRSYFNGNLIGQSTGPSTIPTTSSSLTLGVVEGINWFQGALDDLRIYNRAISLSEVKALYNDTSIDTNLGLIGHYPLNGDYLDYSIYNNTAVNSNTVFSADRFGRANRAAYFDGNSTVIVPDQAQHAQMNTAMTIATWIQFDTPARQIHIIGKSEGQFENKKWILFYNNDPSNYSFLIHQPPTSTFGGKATWPFATNTWYHLAAVKNGTTYSTYINGVRTGSSTGPSTIPTIANNIIIGGAEGNDTPNSVTLQFKGNLDDVRFYNRALSQREIQSLVESKE